MLFRFLLLSLFVWAAASIVHGSDIIGAPEIIPVSPTAVTIRWRTDVPTGTRLYYGLTADQLGSRADGELSEIHEVTVRNLQPSTTYYFAASTAKKRLATGTFATSASSATSAAPPSASPATKHSDVSVSPPASPAATPAPAPTPAQSAWSGLANYFKRPAPSATVQAPPARITWAHPDSLPDHFARHGPDFSARDPEDYARMAWELGQRAKTEHLPTKIDETGVRRVFDPKTGAFAAFNPDGKTKTFFKPGNPSYFDRQPGRLVSP